MFNSQASGSWKESFTKIVWTIVTIDAGREGVESPFIPPYTPYDKAGCTARLPLFLNGSVFMVPLRFGIDAATDFRRCFEDQSLHCGGGISVLNRNTRPPEVTLKNASHRLG
jgi:hypothetical protein